MKTETGKTGNDLTEVEGFGEDAFGGIEKYQKYAGDEFVVRKVEGAKGWIASLVSKMTTSVWNRENPAIGEGKGLWQESMDDFDFTGITVLIDMGGQLGEVRGEIQRLNAGAITEEGTQNKMSVPEELGMTTGNRIRDDVLYASWNKLRQEVLNVFLAGQDEDFEDGMVNAFSERLCRMVKKYGKTTITEIGHLIDRGNISDEVVGEALRCLGRLDNPETHKYRLWLLEKSLSCFSVYLRDCAALGIGSMDDISAVLSLESAVEQETNKELKKDMAEVLAELKG